MDLAHSSKLGWRWLAAACLAVTAAVHIAIAPDHLREAPYAGVLFIALSCAALAAAILLLATEHRLAWTGAAALSGAALLGYLLSRSVGLPSLGDDIGDWLNPLGVAAVAAETAVILIAGYTQQAYRIVTATERLYTVVPAGPIDPAG
jgi:hypothetical protein